MVVEDLHWIDPTSLDLVKRIATDLAEMRILMLGSHRSGWSTDLVARDHVSLLALARLGEADVIELTRAIAGAEISDQVLRDVAERTDGNPLYIEEFTRAVMGGGPVAKGERVPVSLMSSLMARLDQLGNAKPVAQAASIIGREFSRDLLTELVDAAPRVVDSALQRIVAAGLVLEMNTDTGTEFSFKHALVRDAAYESVLRLDRRRLHRRIADRLAEKPVAGVLAEPEIVAQHYWEAEDWERSLLNWRRAGASAVATAAFEEASSHFDRALVALTRLPGSSGDPHTEMEILLDLAPATMSVRGYASEEPKQLYDRAYELARDVGDENDRFTALWGGYFNTEMRAQWNESGENIERLLELDTTELRADLPIQIDHAAMAYSNATGRFDRCLVHAQQIADRYDPELHESHKFRFGAHDPCVCAFNQMAFAQMKLGYPERAIDSMRRSQALAVRLDHPPSRAHSKWYSGMTLHGLDLLDEARSVIDDAVEYCTEQRVRPLLKTLKFYQLAVSPDREAAYTGLRARVDPMRERNRFGLFVPRLANLYAGLAVEMGDVESALVTVDYSQRVADATGDFSDTGDTYYLRGQALKLSGKAHHEAAMSAFRSGIASSNEQEARFPQLRNAVGLAELLHDLDDQTAARNVLESQYAWFTEGHEMPLLRRAEQLLAELSSD